ncbi:MAG: hypothetical protein KF691_14295 [Phycisphaeraceae bacterium]|nr:hypothetical protein [Phycisphaeraceae bacterium]
MIHASALNLCLGTAIVCASSHAGLTRYIDLPPGVYQYVSGMSADGSTLIVIYPYLSAAWLWRDSAGYVSLPNATYPRHGGLSRDGSMVVGGKEGQGAFRLHVESMQYDYPPSNSPDARAIAISPDGATVLYTSDAGTFLWQGASEIRVMDTRTESGRISDDGRVVGIGAGYSSALWTQEAGLQQLNTGYVREVFVSSDGTNAMALDEYGRRSQLRFWQVLGNGTVIAGDRLDVDVVGVGGASPDCSIIGIYPSYNPYPGPQASFWRRGYGFGTITDLFAPDGAALPGLLYSEPWLGAISASNRIFAGTADFVTRAGEYTRKIWLVDLDRSCPGELTFDALVDDDDFVVFAAAYSTYACPAPEDESPFGCDADLDHSGFVDDADFVIFAQAYDTMLCP